MEMINNYLINHSLKEKFVKSLGWTWKENATTIAIPIYDINGKLLYSRYRHLEGTNKFSTDKGSHPALYCSHKIKKEGVVVLAEGEPDTARLWQEGIPAVTGTSGVKTFSSALALPLRGKTVTICLDNDEGGQSSIEQYYNVLKEAGAKPQITQLPQEFKDVSDYFTAGYTKKDFEKLPVFKTPEDWKDANLPEDFEWETANELLKRNIPQNKWLVDRIIPTEGFCFIVGQEATGKSFYSLTLAHSIATGKSWLNKFEVLEKGNVLIIDKENTKKRTQDRIRGLNFGCDNLYWLKVPAKLELASPETESGYTQFIESISYRVKKHKIRFIIIDAFTDILIGNENDRGEVQKFFDAMKQLFPEVSMAIIHHASKPAQGVIRTSSQRARGSTNIMAQAYSAFHVETLPKSKTEFTIEQTKAGDAEKLKKFLVEIITKPDPINPGGTLVSELKYKGEVQDQEEKTQQATSFIEEIFTSTGQISRQDLLNLCQGRGASKASVERAIKQLKKSSQIESVRSGRTVSYIWLDSNIKYESK